MSITAEQRSFISRLAEIVSAFPSRAALAKAVGLSPSAVQAYSEGTDPTRRILVALARAANVSLEWLADGRGYKEPHPPVPDGYAAIPFYDVRKADGYVYPLLSGENVEFCYLKLNLFSYPGMQPSKLFMVEATASFVSEVREGDLLVIDETWKTKFVDPRPQLPAGIYLISQQARLSVREVAGVSDESIELVRPGTKSRKELVRVGQQGFTIHGRIIWYGRTLPVPESLEKDAASQRKHST